MLELRNDTTSAGKASAACAQCESRDSCALPAPCGAAKEATAAKPASPDTGKQAKAALPDLRPKRPAKRGAAGGDARVPKPAKKKADPRNPYAQQADSRRRLTVACGALAGVAALSLAVGGWQMGEASSLRAKYETGLTEVVCAKADIAAGHVIAAEDLEVSQVPASYVPATAATSADELVGHAAIVSVSAGTPVSTSYVQAGSTPSTLAQAVSEGNVAFMLDATGAQAASPMLSVGDRVNIMSGGQGQEALTVLSGVKVIAVDGALSGGNAEGYSTLTLDVTEEQAAQLLELTSGDSGTWHITVPPASTASDGASSGSAA